MTNVFGYLRVSGKGQLEGDGLDRQRNKIAAFCAAKGYTVIRWFTDGAVSGTVEVEERRAFAEMLSLTGEATAKIIIVEDASRLARDFIVSELCLRECVKNGLSVFDVSGTDLTVADADPTRKLIRQILGCLVEWEKSQLVAKLRMARERKRRSGEKCEGRKNFDYPYDVICLIVFLRDISKWSWADIAFELERRKTPTRGTEGYWYRGTVRSLYLTEKERRDKEGVAAPVPGILAGIEI